MGSFCAADSEQCVEPQRCHFNPIPGGAHIRHRQADGGLVMMPPVGFLGEKKKVGLMSPSPNSRSPVTVRGRLRDHRHDPAGDHVPILVERDQDHGLDVQDILRLAVRADGEVQIVLEGRLMTSEIGLCAALARSLVLRPCSSCARTAQPCKTVRMARASLSLG
jgi:hypothetical protein